MKILHQLIVHLTSALILFGFSSNLWSATQHDKKVLMVVSGYGKDKGNTAPGYEFDEFAKAYLVLTANDIKVDVASPLGGPVEADDFNPEKTFNAQVLNDDEAMRKLNNTLSTSKINPDDYQGVFLVGGKGAMFDLPEDKALQKLIADIYMQEGVVAAVCHGPAALVDVTLDNGQYLVAGKLVNGFTNTEEDLFGKKWSSQFPFLLEDKLKARGGKFESSAIMLEHVAVDGHLITGQNPTSTVAVANALVKALDISPVHIAPFVDDLTLELVAKVLAGSKEAEEMLASEPDNYHIELVGMYGYYYLNVVEAREEIKKALMLMQLGSPAINNPQLDLKIAKTQQQLGEMDASARTLKGIIVRHPDFSPAHQLLKTMVQ